VNGVHLLSTGCIAMLELELDSLDGLDESLQSFYEEKDGQFRLKVNGLDDAVAGKSALIKERQARKEANEKLALYEAEKLEQENKLRQEQEDALRQKGEFQTLYDQEKQNSKAAHERYEKLMSTIANDKIETNAVKIAASIGVDEASQELLTEQARKFIVYEDGKTVFKIGGVEVDKDTVLKTLSDKYPRLVKADGGSGAGAEGNRRGGVPSLGKVKQEAIQAAKKSGDTQALRKAHSMKE
jgi:hypothetical protein